MSDESMGPCPGCGGPTGSWGACHTYGGTPDGKGWMACMGCYSALEIFCAANDGDGCGKWDGYTWGHNPRNPRFKDEESKRPEWLKGDWSG
jgi:hypothetical protein